MKPDGNPVWLMQVGANKIEIVCSVYSRWDQVWSNACENFVKVLSIFSEEQKSLHLGATDMAVKDVFLAPGANASVGTLFRRSEMLPASIFADRGPNWHCHTGWIVSMNEQVQTLHNLNIDSVFRGGDTYIEIAHYQLRNTGVDLPVDQVARDFETIQKVYSDLHLGNKKVVSEILSAQVSNSIGLKAK